MPQALNDLTDVTITNQQPGDIIVWDPATLMWVNQPKPASCATCELGGTAGPVFVGAGQGIPSTVEAAYTLRADSIVAVATTPPAGGDDVFEVRLMPSAAVITTGTFADGSQTATFTPFVDVAVAAGDWFETVFTSVAGSAEDVTVAGSLCGDGSIPSGGGGSSVVEVTQSATLPAAFVSQLVNLIAVDGTNQPGLYRWDGAAYVAVDSVTANDVDTYPHTQTVAATVWAVVHNLGYRPAGVFIEDTAGNDIDADITHVSDNQLNLTFAVPTAGTARVG